MRTVAAVRLAAERVHDRLLASLEVYRKHGAIPVGAAVLRDTVELPLHLKQTGSGIQTIRPVILERVDDCFRPCGQVDREHRSAPDAVRIAGAVGDPAAIFCCAVKRAVHLDEPGQRRTAIRRTARKGMQYRFNAGIRIEREDGAAAQPGVVAAWSVSSIY